ncbi:MAG: thioredoxin [Candidatus Bathyarchaeia archaeon]
MVVKEVSSKTFDEDVLGPGTLAVVDFWATWCPWCIKLAPVLEELSAEYNGKITFAKVDVDPNREIARNYGIKSLPTLLFFCEGRPIGALVGYVPREKLQTEFEKIMKTHKECIAQSSPVK